MAISADREAILEKIALYEKEGRWSEDVENDPPGKVVLPGTVDYETKKLSHKLAAKIALRSAHRFYEKNLKDKAFILKEIKGIENLNELNSGAILTCNHFSAMDSFAMSLLFDASKWKKKKKLYRIIREGNYTSFPGFFGYLMRNCYTLPLSSNKAALKEMMESADRILKRGDLVLVYPEQSMWWNYRKPKPTQKGAFILASKAEVPTLPIFITMEDSSSCGEDGYPIQIYTIHVGKPIQPSPEKSMMENAKIMQEENDKQWKEIYEDFYHIPLSYEQGK